MTFTDQQKKALEAFEKWFNADQKSIDGFPSPRSVFVAGYEAGQEADKNDTETTKADLHDQQDTDRTDAG